MSLIPAFEIGVWNAWIFTLYFILHTLFVFRIFKEVEQRMAHSKEEEKKINTIMSPFFFLLLLYSVFLPIKLGTIWFYTGLSIYLLGLIVLTLFFMSVAASPSGKPVTQGVYRYSRHPMYVSVFLLFIGVGIASASWLYLFFSIVLMVGTHFVVITEEQGCLIKYGNAYREYMSRTPRWIGISKS